MRVFACAWYKCALHYPYSFVGAGRLSSSMPDLRTRCNILLPVSNIFVSPRLRPFDTHPKTRELKLRARLYTRRCGAPLPVDLRADDDRFTRFPILEPILDTEGIQAFLHVCNVRLYASSQCHTFRIFFRWHRRLRINTALPGNAAQHDRYRGDVVIARIGQRCDQPVVNFRGGDASLSDSLAAR